MNIPYLALALQAASSNPVTFALPLVVMFAIMYFLLFLPMQRTKKQQQKMLSELKSGDIVVNSGGLVGTIISLDKDTVIIRVKPDNVKLQISRISISSLVPAADATVVK